jgi:uncharacterized membrane protein (GlpM family)
MAFIIKIIVSALLIALISELSKRFSPLAAILASLPINSIIAIIWLYSETKDLQKIIDLSNGIFWSIFPSLLFFILLPIFLKAGIKFPLALFLSSFIMTISYFIYIFVLSRLGVKVN